MSATLSLFDTKLDQDINQLDRTILQLDQQITETQAKRAIEVHAPADGTLTSIRVHAGEQITSGAPLLTLLPTSGKLNAHFFVDSSAIGFVEAGQRVVMRYSAFPFQRYGLYRGTVREVTRAPFRPNDPGLVARDDGTRKSADGLYRIVVEPELDYVEAHGEHKPLEAGMEVDADIAIETHRLYSYIFDPAKHLQHSIDLVTGGIAR
jgi:membrane fusion protein